MRLFVFFFLSLSLLSCQGVANWLSEWKDYSLTQLASQATDSNLAPKDKEELLDLFLDIRETSKCSQVQRYLENHSILRLFEKEFKLNKGYLFDVFLDYDYEKSLLNLERTPEENVAFTVVSVWKTKFSLEEIEEVIVAVRSCYPYTK